LDPDVKPHVRCWFPNGAVTSRKIGGNC
jgi:hypothetical protein